MEAPSPFARLGDLAAVVDAELHGDRATPVREAAYDTRAIPSGSLFFCIPGVQVDGHGFAQEAVASGAAALVVERWLEAIEAPQVLVRSVRGAMGPVSAALFGHPAAAMRSVGVTGTNGKTTTTYLLDAVFREAGLDAGVIGTTGAFVGARPVPIARTTPEAPDLQRVLATMRDAGVQVAALEVSSHALDQRRVDGTRFDVAVFTNLSQDHLDHHGSMERYFAAKARLFTPALAANGIVNVDDEPGRRIAAGATVPVLTCAVDGPADVVADAVQVLPGGSTFRVRGVEVRVRLRGRFNVANALGAILAAESLGIDPSVAAAGVASLERVPGRMDPVEAGQPFSVVVDYAHTPDSIQHVLRGARPLVAGTVIVVFGCGGDRDPAKRSPMGAAATSSADLTVITTDNPRSEDPLAIIAQIEEGARQGGGLYTIEPDRRLAIRHALAAAGPDDIVVIAGKGHETTQETAGISVPFDDREVAREELRALGWDAP